MKLILVFDDPASGKRIEIDGRSEKKVNAVLAEWFGAVRRNRRSSLKLVPRIYLLGRADRILERKRKP